MFREGGRWNRQDTETADQCTEGGSAVSRGTEWIVYKLKITSIMSFIIESLLNLFSCYHLILFLSIFLSVFLLLMTLAALNWCTNSTLSLFDFTQDAVAEHKQEMQKKKDEIERLKKGITVPDVESKVSVVWLEFWDMICARKDDIFGELFSAFLKTWTLHVQWLKMLKSRFEKKNIYFLKIISGIRECRYNE